MRRGNLKGDIQTNFLYTWSNALSSGQRENLGESPALLDKLTRHINGISEEKKLPPRMLTDRELKAVHDEMTKLPLTILNMTRLLLTAVHVVQGQRTGKSVYTITSDNWKFSKERGILYFAAPTTKQRLKAGCFEKIQQSDTLKPMQSTKFNEVYLAYKMLRERAMEGVPKNEQPKPFFLQIQDSCLHMSVNDALKTNINVFQRKQITQKFQRGWYRQLCKDAGVPDVDVVNRMLRCLYALACVRAGHQGNWKSEVIKNYLVHDGKLGDEIEAAIKGGRGNFGLELEETEEEDGKKNGSGKECVTE